jgi:hypothetical protein
MYEHSYGHVAFVIFILVPCALIAVMLFKLAMNELNRIQKKSSQLKNRIELEKPDA